jgi:hypothetical protein
MTSCFSLNRSTQKRSLTQCHIQQHEHRSIPIARQLSAQDGELLDQEDTAIYRELTGCLMYLCRDTRPDISYSVGVLARYMKQPWTLHLKAA